MRLSFTFILTILLSFTGTHALPSSSFTGQGQAVIIENDLPAAEKIARNAARMQALTQAMEFYISTGEVDRHQYNVKKAELLRGNHGFILAERIVNRNLQNVILKLSLQIDVDIDALGKFLGMEGLATRKQVEKKRGNKPTVVVIVAEELNGAMNSFPYSIGVIQDHLLEQDYPLVDQTAAARSSKHDQAVQAMLNNDTASARAVALQFDAGLMITGRAVVQRSGIQGGGMNSYGANIALSAIAADSGRVLATSSAAGNYPHVNQMLGSRLAIEEATSKAIDQLLEKLNRAEYDLGTALRLTVSGVNYQQLTILKKILQKEFSSVEEIDTRGFSGDVARLDVTLTDSVIDFAEALSIKNFGGFQLKVLSQSSEKVDTVLVRK